MQCRKSASKRPIGNTLIARRFSSRPRYVHSRAAGKVAFSWCANAPICIYWGAAEVIPKDLPRIYCGVWRRTLLEGEGLVTDTSSTVLWLQTPLWHADLRLPVFRPSGADVARFADCSSTDIRRLAQQQGFSGITQVEGDVCTWLRDVDFQPEAKTSDMGRMVFLEGGVLEEYGVEVDYHETWQRLPDGDGPCACWEHGGNGMRRERLLVAGDCFFLIRDRETPLPPPIENRYLTLSDLVFQRPHLAVDWLGLTLAYGRIRGGGTAWQIEHATLPWLGGKSLQTLALGPAESWTERLREAGTPMPPFEGS